MLKEQRTAAHRTESNPERDREVVRACLARLSPDCSREEWIKVGMALHSLGDDMLDDWHQWSAGGATYKASEADRQWKTFKRDGKGLGIGTLVKMAGLTKDELRGMGSNLRGGGRMSIRRHTQKISAASVIEPKAPRPSAPAEADGKPTFPTLDAAVQACTPQGFTEAGRWRYRDDHWVVRFDGTQGKRVVPFTCDAAGQWSNRGPERRTLYGQDDLPADADAVVLVLEGEKCVDIASSLGFPAVTSGASSTAGKADWSALQGRQVVVLPDCDDAGQKYADAVREQLQAIGCSVAVLNLPGLETGEDIEQWEEREGEGAADALHDLVSDACTAAPLPDMLQCLEDMVQGFEDTQGRRYLGLPCGMPQLDRMLDGFRGLVFMSAAPGCGKTNLALQASAGVVTQNPDAAVLFVTLEMTRDELMARLVCQFAEGGVLDWHALVKGRGIDAEKRGRVVAQAQGRLADVLPRLHLLGTTDLHRLMRDGSGVVPALRQAVRQLKRQTGAKRCMVVIDNFAHLPMRAANLTDLELERQKTVELLALQEQIGEAVLVIAQQSKDAVRTGEAGMTAVKGAVEQVYGCDAVLNLTMPPDTHATVDPRGIDGGVRRLADREGNPLPVVKLKVAKGRDGMNRGTMHLLFDHELFQMVELKQDQIEKGGSDA